MDEGFGDLNAAVEAAAPQRKSQAAVDLPFRQDLAFPCFSDEVLERLCTYGHAEDVPDDTLLYTYGDRDTDMFVILSGQIESRLLVEGGGSKCFRMLSRGEFTGELNLLNTQRTVALARTASASRLLRISRKKLGLLMRAEGDLANVVVSACIWRRLGMMRDASVGIVLRGSSEDPELLNLRRFLVRNYFPHRVEESPAVQDAGASATAAEVQLLDGRVLARPSVCDLADELGITELPEPGKVYDVAVVGAGPAGLAAAVYSASEGLSTIVVEANAPGGQAGTSSKIENYLGFPTGISGAQLASRGHLQALKFGVHFAISREVVGTEQLEGKHRLVLSSGLAVCARTVVIATGARYRRLNLPNQDRFENRGLHYAATAMEAALCRDREIIVVGGGNSAGQASIFLSGVARHVHHIIRGTSLASSMSEYLITRIERSPKISLHTQSEIVELEGSSGLEFVTWADIRSGDTTRKQIANVFVMIGAEPNSGWLYGAATLDQKGFVLTGGGLGFEATPFATSMPGIYAVGDIRADSVKRVASAVGEGSVVISNVHRYLAQLRSDLPPQPKAD